LIVTGNLPPGNQPGTVEGIILMATSWKIALPFVWCEDSKDKLDAAWANFSFSMMLDDQPVDLKPFKEADFDDSGTPCRTLDVVLTGVPQGLHHLVVTRNVKNEFETGSNGRKVATGDYTYDIALLSFAPNPNPSKPAALSEFKLGSVTGPNATYPHPAESFYYYSDWQEQYKPGTARFTAVLFADQPYGLMGGWCAKDQPTLEENWKKMTYSASINGQPIDLSNVPTTDRQQGSQYCRQWDLMMTPPEGQHQIIVKLNFSAATNDGTTTYPAGDYITEYTLISLKLGNQP
jgi:hypothetical protein